MTRAAAGRAQPELGCRCRPPRAGPAEAGRGSHYHFLDDAEFDRRVAAGDFLAHAAYCSEPLRDAGVGGASRGWSKGDSVVLEIEVQGARQVREAMPEAVTVFIAPPSVEGLCAGAWRGGGPMSRKQIERAAAGSRARAGRTRRVRPRGGQRRRGRGVGAPAVAGARTAPLLSFRDLSTHRRPARAR